MVFVHYIVISGLSARGGGVLETRMNNTLNNEVANESRITGSRIQFYIGHTFGKLHQKDWENLMAGWQQIVGNLLNNRYCPQQGVEIFGMAA